MRKPAPALPVPAPPASARLAPTLLVAALLAPALAALPAAAQDWPARTVRIVVPFGPGSTPDMVGRLLAERLQMRLGQTFVVENRPGAGAITGTDLVAKAEPDGYTLGISLGGPLAINTLLGINMPYDPARDIALVTLLTRMPSALAVNASLGVSSVAELVALLKRDPGKYNYGSIGKGSLSHLAMEALALKSGTRIVHVPYPGSPAAMTAMLRNDVQMSCLPAIAVTPHLPGGQIKMLAISLGQRSTLLPGVPTLKESGIDVEADAWNGLIAPGKTPEPLVARIQQAVAAALVEPAVREKLATQLMEPAPTTPAQFRARIDADMARWAPVIKAIN
jgi:tripartite-type tricarboxylate transporter receptor subunit TctC